MKMKNVNARRSQPTAVSLEKRESPLLGTKKVEQLEAWRKKATNQAFNLYHVKELHAVDKAKVPLRHRPETLMHLPQIYIFSCRSEKMLPWDN